MPITSTSTVAAKGAKKRSMYAVANYEIVKQTSAKKKSKKDPSKEIWVRDKSKGKAIIEYTTRSARSIEAAYASFNDEEKKGIQEGMTKDEQQWSTRRGEEIVDLYKENFNQTDLPLHKYERQTQLDQTYLN